MTNQINETWLSITEYCEYRRKSISTVRRYIKSNNLTYKLIDGKYYILVKNYNQKVINTNNEDLIEEIKKLKIENQELKMLIELYEEKLNINFKPKQLQQIRQ